MVHTIADRRRRGVVRRCVFGHASGLIRNEKIAGGVEDQRLRIRDSVLHHGQRKALAVDVERNVVGIRICNCQNLTHVDASGTAADGTRLRAGVRRSEIRGRRPEKRRGRVAGAVRRHVEQVRRTGRRLHDADGKRASGLTQRKGCGRAAEDDVLVRIECFDEQRVAARTVEIDSALCVLRAQRRCGNDCDLRGHAAKRDAKEVLPVGRHRKSDRRRSGAVGDSDGTHVSPGGKRKRQLATRAARCGCATPGVRPNRQRLAD